MNLSKEHWRVSFQSRLGRAKWIGPSTQETLEALAKEGHAVAVLCPSFVADCLETLEEIGIEEKNRFIAHGGKEFTLISCLNSDPAWVEGFAHFLKQNITAKL